MAGNPFTDVYNKIKSFLPIIGFYTIMNLPIYGIGLLSTGNANGFIRYIVDLNIDYYV